jgi:hypothetical protein
MPRNCILIQLHASSPEDIAIRGDEVERRDMSSIRLLAGFRLSTYGGTC